MKMLPRTTVVVLFVLSGVWASAEEFSWQKTHAEISSGGDIKWSPRPFRFVKGDSVRYIDYEGGSDSNDGLTKNTPWKHHPWDRQASGNSKQCKGIHTYVFKRGGYYRGTMNALESGRKGSPIRLTSDPAWGTGDAVISGGYRITGGWKKGAENKDIPEPARIWYVDLDFAPRTVYLVEPSGKSASRNDKITRIPLARMPNSMIGKPLV